jgi:hypothetical protein
MEWKTQAGAQAMLGQEQVFVDTVAVFNDLGETMSGTVTRYDRYASGLQKQGLANSQAGSFAFYLTSGTAGQLPQALQYDLHSPLEQSCVNRPR